MTAADIINLGDVVDLDDLADHIKNGYVNVQTHPSLDLLVYNYSRAAQYDNHWTPVTIACRGLITDGASNIVARPFRKFFNYGQVEVACAGEVTVYDKADGSLGIIYPTPGGVAVATRGSFASPQAKHATETLRRLYPDFVAPPGVTYLVEIIFPDNRVVVDYAAMDDLVFLGAVDNATGKSADFDTARALWPGPAVTKFNYASLAAAVEAEPRDNAEGLVVHFHQSDERLKLKQQDYVDVHAAIFSISARAVLEAVKEGNGERFDELIDLLPDEVYDWLAAVRADIDVQYARIEAAVEKLACELVTQVEAEGFNVDADASAYFKRIAQILIPRKHALMTPIMRRVRNQDIDIWKHVETPDIDRRLTSSKTADPPPPHPGVDA